VYCNGQVRNHNYADTNEVGKGAQKNVKEIGLSFVLMVAIGVVAAFGLKAMDWSAETRFTSQQGNVRVN
jgi:hypothetical protein